MPAVEQLQCLVRASSCGATVGGRGAAAWNVECRILNEKISNAGVQRPGLSGDRCW